MLIAQKVEEDYGVRLFINWQNAADMALEAVRLGILEKSSEACRRLDDMHWLGSM